MAHKKTALVALVLLLALLTAGLSRASYASTAISGGIVLAEDDRERGDMDKGFGYRYHDPDTGNWYWWYNEARDHDRDRNSGADKNRDTGRPYR
jgi:hypothetical protein